MTGARSESPLWFFWGQPELSFLRYATLATACRVHQDVRLIVRKDPPDPLSWKGVETEERFHPTVDWMPRVADLRVWVQDINDFCPEIAGMKAPGVHTGDLLKWWTLWKYGGHVADMDVAFIKPLPVIEHDVEASLWPAMWGIGRVPMALIQGRPCDEWGRLYHAAVEAYSPADFFSTGSTRIGFVPETGHLPRRTIAPWAGTMEWSYWHSYLFESAEWPRIPDECVGIHWHAGRNNAVCRMTNGPDELTLGAVAWAVHLVH